MSDKTPNLQDLFYNFTVLYERWTADKLELTKQIIKTEQLVKEFTAKINEFDKMNVTTRNELAAILRGAGSSINKDIAETIKQSIAREVKGTIGELESANAESQKELDKWQKQAKSSIVGGVLVAVVASFLVSLATVTTLLPTPKLALTNEQAGFLAGGRVIARIYPKLTPAEQKHLNGLTGELAQDLLQNK